MSNHKRALEVLTIALDEYEPFEPSVLTAEQRAAIRDIILGDHKTFRYLLITGLLGKVVDPSVHPRSIQAKADLEGAYDARSLCHNVWVPFEREHLDCRLGGSNEPYLNKPARFEAVDKNNAVRAGKDRKLLHTLYDLLESLNDASGETVKEAFTYAFQLTMSRQGRTITDLPLKSISLSSSLLEAFFDDYLSQSFGGEIPVSVAGAILGMRYNGKGESVRIHPANQAGSSSNEVGDIDVYSGDIVILPVEVKDKPYLQSDVNHAVEKAKYAKCGRLLFVTGRQATTSLSSTSVVAENSNDGFDLAFISIDELVRAECALMNETDRRQLLELVNRALTTMRSKDEAKRYFASTLKRHGIMK
ncbi:restriction endonuclease, SacI family [Roseimaritima sediminicola]|uniref:restriction endonuclease, SacI family n=1 Tax=Roseimaritima sediminicola TaxID=2662066 RepID=UPI0013874A3A|nr:restriction endonuclease, SacI family [Roseimaritima sediminicola]